jgi:hypothetical protein
MRLYASAISCKTIAVPGMLPLLCPVQMRWITRAAVPMRRRGPLTVPAPF